MVNNIKRSKIYEGSTKTLFESSDPETMVQHFRDDIIASSGSKKGLITGKGVINNRISEYIMIKLANIGIPTHFVKSLNMREQLVRKVEIIPVKVMVSDRSNSVILL
ncbi:MAG: hypothetical protein EOO61_16870 [Hymenobacter sp.]|nr:MAG: hypothetical protein EOO61_16870 [Hymenobacter sp.]